MMGKDSLVLYRTDESLHAGDLRALIEGGVLAIRVGSFCPPEACGVMNDRLACHPQRQRYIHAPEISRVMEALYESYQNPEARQRYYDRVVQSTIDFRRLSWPYLNPMDHLRIALADLWPAGAVRENIEGRTMAFGLAQLFEQGAFALPHQDFLRFDEPENPRAQLLVTQVTALVYTQPAEEGGFLQLWSERYEHDDFEARRKPGTYGLDYDKLAEPPVVIAPTQGELILADSTRVHAVSTVQTGLRIAVSCFLGFYGFDQPLTFWS